MNAPFRRHCSKTKRKDYIHLLHWLVTVIGYNLNDYIWSSFFLAQFLSIFCRFASGLSRWCRVVSYCKFKTMIFVEFLLLLFFYCCSSPFSFLSFLLTGFNPFLMLLSSTCPCHSPQGAVHVHGIFVRYTSQYSKYIYLYLLLSDFACNILYGK